MRPYKVDLFTKANGYGVSTVQDRSKNNMMHKIYSKTKLIIFFNWFIISHNVPKYGFIITKKSSQCSVYN